jgi:1-acyl-sn-glycerol-3-phosphate acyltransferase
MALNTANNDETAFSIGHIPGTEPIELKRGDLLEEGGHRIAEIFESTADHVPSKSGIRLATKALRQAGYGLLQIPGKLTTMHSLGKAEKPHDREFVRMRDEKARTFVEDFLGRFVAEESAVFGAENVRPAVEANRKGEPVIQMGNHGTELDPVLNSILLDREQKNRKHGDQTTANALAEAREKMLAVIGHKVMLEKFRRIFAGSVHSLFTISAKYRDGLQGEDRDISSAYINNVNTVLEELISNPEYLVMLFPEGGRTRNNQIGMQMGVVRAATGKLILPTFIDAPDGFMELEQGEKMDLKPQTVNLYFGKPFMPNGGTSAKKGIDDFVGRFRDSLGEVGAPVGDYEWGVMKREKRNGDQPRELQFHEVA